MLKISLKGFIISLKENEGGADRYENKRDSIDNGNNYIF